MESLSKGSAKGPWAGFGVDLLNNRVVNLIQMLEILFHKDLYFDHFFFGLRAELTLSRQPQYIKNASH